MCPSVLDLIDLLLLRDHVGMLVFVLLVSLRQLAFERRLALTNCDQARVVFGSVRVLGCVLDDLSTCSLLEQDQLIGLRRRGDPEPAHFGDQCFLLFTQTG